MPTIPLTPYGEKEFGTRQCISMNRLKYATDETIALRDRGRLARFIITLIHHFTDYVLPGRQDAMVTENSNRRRNNLMP